MSRNEHDPRRSGRRGLLIGPAGAKVARPAAGGLRADRVVRPYKDFYKIHSMHTRPGRCK